MDPKRESPKTNEYYVTALQIFDSFQTDHNGLLRANKLMEQFAPYFVKTNKSEYALLKSLLDPEQTNPEINVTMLADALTKYSETQKIKPDLEESFNLKGEDLPHDSDSGISSDGFQHLEELQCGLREKSRIVSDLRSQLEHTEEIVATLTAEKDSLRTHLKMLRDENQSLSQARRECEDASEQLAASEAALSEARRHLEDSRRRAAALADKLAGLESDKVILQELLSKSKDECHRINEMYSSRQAGLIELNESLRAQCADLADRLLRQEDYVQAVTKEKSSLEMELKDMLNKPNQLLPRLDRSIEVSYTEDQMLTALDSLNSESRFVNEFTAADEDSFLRTFNGDAGRPTNVSLFDEIRFSFGGNFSKMKDFDLSMDRSCDNECYCKRNRSEQCTYSDAEIQTEVELFCNALISSRLDLSIQTDYVQIRNFNTKEIQIQTEIEVICNEKHDISMQTDSAKVLDCSTKEIEIQTDFVNVPNILPITSTVAIETQTVVTPVHHTQIQTDDIELNDPNNNVQITQCHDCSHAKNRTTKLARDLKRSRKVIKELKAELNDYEQNVQSLKQLFDEEKDANTLLQTALNSVNNKLLILENACVQQKKALDVVDSVNGCAVQDKEVSSVSTQAEVPCEECVKRVPGVPMKSPWRRSIWDGVKSLFSVFAGLCFLGALFFLYQVSHYHYAARRCLSEGPIVPWRWFSVHDILDFLFRIEYVGEVPM